jgi:hypothetical protein
MKSPQMPNPYGLNINLATAKKIALAATKEAERLKINVTQLSHTFRWVYLSVL